MHEARKARTKGLGLGGQGKGMKTYCLVHDCAEDIVTPNANLQSTRKGWARATLGIKKYNQTLQ